MTELASSPITLTQMRDARTSLGWTRQSLSFASGATVHFINVYEESGRVGRQYLRRAGFDAMNAIRIALEAAGIKFVDENGNAASVKLQKAR